MRCPCKSTSQAWTCTTQISFRALWLYPRWLTVRRSLCDRGCTPVGHVCRPADPTVCIFVAVYKIARGRANQAHKDTRKLRSRSGETGVSSIMCQPAMAPEQDRYRSAIEWRRRAKHPISTLRQRFHFTRNWAAGLPVASSFSDPARGGCWLAVFACVLYDGACIRHRTMWLSPCRRVPEVGARGGVSNALLVASDRESGTIGIAQKTP